MVDPFFNEIIILLKVIFNRIGMQKTTWSESYMVFHILKAEDFVKLEVWSEMWDGNAHLGKSRWDIYVPWKRFHYSESIGGGILKIV